MDKSRIAANRGRNRTYDMVAFQRPRLPAGGIPVNSYSESKSIKK